MTIAPANGETDFAACTVRVRPSLSPAQRAKTLAHEVAHVRLHAPDGPGGSLPRGLKEVEAESVAWLVAKEAGLTADDYSFPYVATWSGGDVECVRATIERVLPAAREITDSLALALGAARGNGAARLEPVERSEALNLAAALLPRDDASVGLETT